LIPPGEFDMGATQAEIRDVTAALGDGFDPDYFGSSPRTDPAGPAASQRRVKRGGGWSGGGLCHRSAFRYHEDPLGANTTTGFRVVWDAFREPLAAESEARSDPHGSADVRLAPADRESGVTGDHESQRAVGHDEENEP